MIETSNDDGFGSSRHRRRSADLSEFWPEIEPRLIASLRGKGARFHDAQDIAQDTACRVLQKTQYPLSSPEEMLRFAYYVAGCFWKDKRKRLARERLVLIGDTAPRYDDVAVEAVDRIMSVEAWGRLNARDQEVLAFSHLPASVPAVYEARNAARKRIAAVVTWLGAFAPWIKLRSVLRRIPARRFVVAAAALTIAICAEELTHSRPARRPAARAPKTLIDKRLSPEQPATRSASESFGASGSGAPTTRVAAFESAVQLPNNRVVLGPSDNPLIIVGNEDSKENEPIVCYGVVPVVDRTICVGNSTVLEELLLLR